MLLKCDHRLFEQEIQRRCITFLVHFTPTINLINMINTGFVYSWENLEKLCLDYADLSDYIEFSDKIRMDDKRYINLSIQHPNTCLFKNFKDKDKDKPYINWCILKIKPKYIYERYFVLCNKCGKFI